MPTLPIQAKATTGVGKPKADSEGNERIPPDGFDTTALEVHFMGEPLHHTPHSTTTKAVPEKVRLLLFYFTRLMTGMPFCFAIRTV